MENEIHVYAARDRFRRMRKKVFKGHMNAGFACQITFSPNGRYMASGDGSAVKLWGANNKLWPTECGGQGDRNGRE